MSSSNVRQIEDSVQFCDAPYPIIANPLPCLHQNPAAGRNVVTHSYCRYQPQFGRRISCEAGFC